MPGKSAVRSVGSHIFISALAIAFCLSSIKASSSAQEKQEKITVDDSARSFVVHLPQGYDKSQHYPVVVLFHGEQQDADDLGRLTHFSQFAEKNGIIAVYPNAARALWNIGVRPDAEPDFARRPFGRRGYPGGGYPGGGGGYPGGGGGYPGGGGGYPGQNPNANPNHGEPADDIGFLNQMLDRIATEYSVDEHRVYAVGLGDGGLMALRSACVVSGRITAIAVVAAELPKTMICLPTRPIAALFLDGTSDPLSPFEGGTYKPGRFHVLSAEASAKQWATFDHCGEKPAQGKIPPPDKTSKETKTYTFPGCHDDSQVILYAMKDGGHTWPDGEQYVSDSEVGKVSHALNANEVIWNFLKDKKLSDDQASH